MASNHGNLKRDLIGCNLNIKNYEVIDCNRNLKNINNATIGPLHVKKNLNVDGEITADGTATLNGQIIIKDPITISVPTLFGGANLSKPTIQSAIDYFSGRHTMNGSILLAANTYNESLTLRKLASAAKDDTNVINNIGFELVGDSRDLANMTYMAGGVVDISRAGFGLNEGRISLVNDSLNKIRILVAGGDPNFTGLGYGLGDIVLIRANNGTWNERTLVSVSGNLIEYSGADVLVGNPGTTVVFCPSVIVSPSQNDTSIVNIAECGVKLKGFWFKNTNTTTNALCRIEHGQVMVDNCLFDARVTSGGFNVLVNNNSTFALLTKNNLGSASTFIGGLRGIAIANNSVLSGASALTATGVAVRCFDCTSAGVLLNVGCGIAVNYTQTMNCNFGIQSNWASGNIIRVFTILRSAAVSIYLANGSTVRLPANSTFPDSIIDGLNANATQSGLFSDRGSAIMLEGKYIIRGVAVGIPIYRGAQVILDRFVNLSFASISQVSIATDEISRFGKSSLGNAPNGEGSLLTVTTSGSLNNAYLNQALNNTLSQITLSFNPATQVGFDNQRIYRDKVFSVTDLAGGQLHQIQLLGGAAFYGFGFTGQTAANFNGIKGSNISLLVLDNLNVIVKSASGVTP